MASETYLPLDSGCLYVRHSAIQRGRPSLVFLHGLGESGLSFSEAFDRPEMAGFNLIVPDLLGFGRSSAAIGGDYTFDAQAARLWRALDILDVETVILIGHSMGGDLATLMTSWKRERVKSLINVEGNLTPEDLFISKKATAAADRSQFGEWFSKDFAQEKVFEDWSRKWASCRRYHASLLFCRQDAFRESARELVQRNGPAPNSAASEMGTLFQSLPLPKVFCWGSKSLTDETQKFLVTAGIQQKRFAGASHWLMADQPWTFYPFLREFCANV